jgi:hypothetical protein
MHTKIATISSLATAVALCLGLAACDKAPEEKKVEPSTTKPADAPKKEEAKQAEPAKAEEKKADAAADSWKPFKAGGGSFVVSMPSEPQCQEQEAGSGMKATICAAETEKTGVMVSSTRMPGEIDPAQAVKALESAMNGSAKAMNGEAVNATDFTTDGLVGKDFTIKTPQGDVRSRMTFKGSYMVQLVAMPKAAADETSKAESEKFLKSLAASKQ